MDESDQTWNVGPVRALKKKNAPVYSYSDDGGCIHTPLSMHHACCSRLTLVMVTQHPYTAIKGNAHVHKTSQKKMHKNEYKLKRKENKNKSRPMMTSNRLL